MIIRRLVRLEVVAAIVAILLGIAALSCYPKKYGPLPNPYHDDKGGGSVHFGFGRYVAGGAKAGEPFEESPTDSLFELRVFFRQKQISPANVRLAADSIGVSYPEQPIENPLTIGAWKPTPRAYNLRSYRTEISLNPIKVPPGYEPELEVSFILSAYDICGDSLIFRHPYAIRVRRD